MLSPGARAAGRAARAGPRSIPAVRSLSPSLRAFATSQPEGSDPSSSGSKESPAADRADRAGDAEASRPPGGPRESWREDPVKALKSEADRLQFEVERALFQKFRDAASQAPPKEMKLSPPFYAPLLGATVWRGLSLATGAAVREAVEKSFDADAFLEGAKDAYWMVTNLANEEDDATLAEMVSPGVMHEMRKERTVARQCGVRVNSPPPAEIEAYLVGSQLWTPEQYERFAGVADADKEKEGSEDKKGENGEDEGGPSSSRPEVPNLAGKGAFRFAPSIEGISKYAEGKYLAAIVRFEAQRKIQIYDLTDPIEKKEGEGGEEAKKDEGAKDTKEGEGGEERKEAGAEATKEAGAEATNGAGAEATKEAGAEAAKGAGAEQKSESGAEAAKGAGAEQKSESGAEEQKGEAKKESSAEAKGSASPVPPLPASDSFSSPIPGIEIRRLSEKETEAFFAELTAPGPFPPPSALTHDCTESHPVGGEPAASLEGKYKVISKIDAYKAQKWAFVRGPLPDGLPVRELYQPWQLVCITQV